MTGHVRRDSTHIAAGRGPSARGRSRPYGHGVSTADHVAIIAAVRAIDGLALLKAALRDVLHLGEHLLGAQHGLPLAAVLVHGEAHVQLEARRHADEGGAAERHRLLPPQVRHLDGLALVHELQQLVQSAQLELRALLRAEGEVAVTQQLLARQLQRLAAVLQRG